MVDENNETNRPNIVKLDTGEWLDRNQLADRLGVSGKQLQRCIESDHIESKSTPDGPRYRYVAPPIEHRDQSPGESNDSTSTKRTDVVAVGLDEWTDARESLARLESRLQASRKDVRRAVEYARELESECDRLADVADKTRRQADEVRGELEEERGRANELRKQYADVVERLEQLSGVRARYHLERARRQEAQEQLEQQSEQIQKMQRKIEQLTEALQKAREAGFSAEIGALTVEWKK